MDFYRDIAEWYDRFFPLSPRKVAFFAELLNDRGARTVLDLACGPGELTRALAGEGFRVTGVDATAEFFGIAGGADAGSFAFCAARMEALPFPDDGLFDAVICAGNSLPHLDERARIETAIGESARILRPGGIFCVQAIEFAHVRSKGAVALPDLRFDQHPCVITLKRIYRVDDEGAAFTPELVIDDVFAHYRIPMYPLEYDLLWDMLRARGFSHAGTYADFNRIARDENAPSYITIARKDG